jgi:hypothetical protein
MKRLPAIWTAMLLGLLVASPALAGHPARHGGHSSHVSGGIFLGVPALPLPHLPVPRIHSSLSLTLGFPYLPRPVLVAPAPVVYASPSVYVAPGFQRVWVPAGYVWNGGARFYVDGHWSYRRCHDWGD